ncbi:hypothetical protein [Pontibacter pamirensis]|uniref:hypothetical protein n=1 Tax=Pontibacter pamirensis TaxID=2562824 RepID=UPI00138A0933|nr:hypothetical protein [Pontibacter pamirensis]
MSARASELLLQTAYESEQLPVPPEETGSIYNDFEKTYKASITSPGKATEELNYCFERLRLLLAIAFVKAFTRLSNNEKSKEALDVLQEALQARSTKEIDKVIQKKIAVFDQLYHEMFVNEQRDQILHLFEQTLDAGTKEELDEIIFGGVALLQEVDWEANEEEDQEDTDPLDEDFLKNL